MSVLNDWLAGWIAGHVFLGFFFLLAVLVCPPVSWFGLLFVVLIIVIIIKSLGVRLGYVRLGLVLGFRLWFWLRRDIICQESLCLVLHCL